MELSEPHRGGPREAGYNIGLDVDAPSSGLPTENPTKMLAPIKGTKVEVELDKARAHIFTTITKLIFGLRKRSFEKRA